MTDPHLISLDELRAAGALDVPPAWRKSLTTERPQQTKSLFDDEDDFDSPSETSSHESHSKESDTLEQE